MADTYNINIETKAQLDEIHKLLEELRAISAEMSKINGQTFSAVSMSAAQLSKTSKDLLTATLANKKAMENVSGATDKASDSSKKFRDETKKTKDEIDGFSSTLQGAYMELGAMGTRLATQLPSAITATIQAFGRQEAAVQKVSEAIRAQGGRVSEVLPIMQNLASEIQRITTYGDEQVLEMQAMASAMGVNAAQMEGAIRTAIGLSTALGMDVMTATKAASAAVQGKTTALQEYIPALSKCTTEAEKLAEVQKLAASGFAQAEAGVDTLDGRLKQCANAWGDLQEVVGEAFAPAVKNVATMLRVVCELVTSMPVAVKALTLSLTSLAVGFAFTKVGGLLKVADSFLGVAGGVRTTTVAMHGLNAAVRANPLGLLATAVTAAIFGISQLVEYVSNLTDAEDEEAQKIHEAYEARRRQTAEMRKAAGVIAAYEAELKKANASAADTAESIEKLSAEIAKLEAAQGNGGTNAVENAQKIVEKKRELAELQKLYVERVKAAADAEFASMANRETERKYQIEKDLNAARAVGIERIVKFREAELAHVEAAQKALEIQKKYYADHAHLVNSEQDRVRIMADAEKFAKMKLGELRQEADAQKWLNAETESAKTRQRDLELDILRARASGNETLAKELEGSQRVAQLASEIFEASRKEGMTRDQLVALQNSANAQARERYNLEKSISDETERQNLAKNAQAKIEDIILANKIEQLKTQGKLREAQALEEEREIRRTLAGLQGVSDSDKKKLGNMMRQTNSYKAQQEQQRGGKAGGLTPQQGFGAGQNSRSTSLGFEGESSALSRKNSLAGGRGFGGGFGTQRGQAFGGGFGQNTLTSGGRRDGLPSTVSAKYADQYAQFKAARKSGAIGANVGWTDFRDGKGAGVEQAKQTQSASAKEMTRQAQNYLGSIESVSAKMAGVAPKGVKDIAETADKKPEPRKLEKKDDEKKTETKTTPARKALTNRTQNPPNQSANSGGKDQRRIVALLESIEKSVRGQNESNFSGSYGEYVEGTR